MHVKTLIYCVQYSVVNEQNLYEKCRETAAINCKGIKPLLLLPFVSDNTLHKVEASYSEREYLSSNYTALSHGNTWIFCAQQNPTQRQAWGGVLGHKKGVLVLSVGHFFAHLCERARCFFLSSETKSQTEAK